MQKEFNWRLSINKAFMLNSRMELNIKHYYVWVVVIVFLQLQLCDNILDIHRVEGLRMAPTSPNRARTPFQDISNNQSLGDEHYTTTQFQFLYPNCWIVTLIADPNEVKRHRDRERYAQNKDEINKRRREAYKQKKIASAEISGAQTQLGVSQGNKDEFHSSLYILLYIMIYSSST